MSKYKAKKIGWLSYSINVLPYDADRYPGRLMTAYSEIKLDETLIGLTGSDQDTAKRISDQFRQIVVEELNLHS